MRAQLATGEPLRKQLWRQIVASKINMQASLLDSFGAPEAQPLKFMARRVRSGDPDNLEAQAARRYWPALLGPDFRRDRNANGANALLNYGYAVMRATVARAVLGAGLHPSIGLHHKSSINSFALADDLIEPFRPLVDAVVRRMLGDGVDAVSPEGKRPLAHLIGADVRLEDALFQSPRNDWRYRSQRALKVGSLRWRCLMPPTRWPGPVLLRVSRMQ